MNASVKYTGNTDKADYVQIYDEFSANSRWPAVVINGKGNYSGFTSTVYFDILPAPLSDGNGAAVTGEGLYRLKLTGMGNYYGSLYDTFNVYGTGKTMFSSLKLKTSTVPYMAPGVDAGSLVTGISTRVTGSPGANVMIDPSDLNVRLEAGTPDAQVDADGKTALSAGKYRAYVSPKDEAAFSGKYPLVAYDGEALATVTVTGQNLDKKMFSTDWNR